MASPIAAAAAAKTGVTDEELNDSGIQEDGSFTDCSGSPPSFVESFYFKELHSCSSPRGVKRNEACCSHSEPSCKKRRAHNDARAPAAIEIMHHVKGDARPVGLDVSKQFPRWSLLLEGDFHCSSTHKGAARELDPDNVGFEEHDTDVYLHRRRLELQFHPLSCLSSQPQITPGMRAVLVEWITALYHQLELHRETLFLTVNIIDRFLSILPISRDCFQLLGITALLIASKMEEVFPPEIADLLNMCRNTYSREQVKQLERIVLCRLQFDLIIPTAHYFLEHYSSTQLHRANLIGYTVQQIKQSRAVARYLLELALQDYNLCQFAPTLLALASLEVAYRIRPGRSPCGIIYCGGYSRESLKECEKEMELLASVFVQNNPDLEWIYEKYTEFRDFSGRTN